MSKDWYDYDKQEATALPPIGTECFVWYDDGRVCWRKCKVLATSPFEDGQLVAMLLESDERKLIWSCHFKPLDHHLVAEKKKVVDAAVNVFEEAACKQTFNMVAGIEALYDLGYLVMPSNKE
jgi:hypothetical protein